MTLRGVYAYLCVACRHLDTEHRLVPAAPIAGPYQCTRCDCQKQQSDPSLTLDQAGYERYLMDRAVQ